jgi:hypothetical protein
LPAAGAACCLLLPAAAAALNCQAGSALAGWILPIFCPIFYELQLYELQLYAYDY